MTHSSLANGMSDLGKNVTHEIVDMWNHPLFYIGSTSLTLSSFIRLIFILLLFYWISKYLLRSISHYAMNHRGIQHALVYRFSRLFHYFIMGIGVIVALTMIGFDFSSFALIAGALGVGLGFGLQSIFNNFLSGIIILFESHLKIGDTIEIPPTNIQGTIKEINFRSTILTNHDGLEVIIPNSEIISNKVINWTLNHPYRRLHIPFIVAEDTDETLLANIIEEKAAQLKHTLHKDGFALPAVLMNALGDHGHEYELVVWLTEKGSKQGPKAKSDYLKMINQVLKENHIHIPRIQRELFISNFLGATSFKDLK